MYKTTNYYSLSCTAHRLFSVQTPVLPSMMWMKHLSTNGVLPRTPPPHYPTTPIFDLRLIMTAIMGSCFLSIFSISLIFIVMCSFDILCCYVKLLVELESIRLWSPVEEVALQAKRIQQTEDITSRVHERLQNILRMCEQKARNKTFDESYRRNALCA